MIDAQDCIVSFGAGISEEVRNDISDLLLAVARMADATRDRNAHWKGWVDYHCNRLRKHACTKLSTVTTGPLFISSRAEVEGINIGIHGGYDNLERVKELGAYVLRTMDLDGFAEQFFNGGQAGDTLQSWQIAPCERNQHGQIILMTFGVHVTTNRGHRAGGSEGPLDGEMIVHVNGGVYLFEPDDYSAFFRDDIRQALIGTSLRRLSRLEME